MMDGQIRVKTDVHYARIYNDLKGVVVGDFHELFFLCVCLGYKYKQKIPLQKNRDDRFWSSTINANEWACYYAICLLDHNMDFMEIKDDKSVISIVEEYANGGMKILLQEFLEDYISKNKTEPQLDAGFDKELPKNFLHSIFDRVEGIGYLGLNQ